MISDPAQVLLAAAGSTPYDLAENRMGRLTPQQYAAHRQRLRWQLWPTLAAWSLIAAVLSIVPLTGSLRWDWAVGFVASLLIPLWYALRLRRSLRKLARDEYVIDRASFKIRDGWKLRATAHGVVFVAGDYKLLMPRRVLPLLRDKCWYRVYFLRAPDGAPLDGFTYTPGGYQLVLSIEPVGQHA